MTTRTRIDPRKHFVPRFLPWFLALAAFAVYWLTLNRWISPLNFERVARVSGWTWQPDLIGPVTFLVTYPLHWLPASQIPLALNVLSAVCAALALGLLARSVALLPHDRTEAQRKRERSDFSFLTLGSAWLPPVLAVVGCGLQMSFWENATNFTGEMLDLLLFAFVIWSLLEYRLDEREGRLFLAAVVYGASLANNWAMVGFFPAFVVAVVWNRGLSFFNLQFIRRMLVCGLLGMTFYFLLPLLTVISGKTPLTFWEALKSNLIPQYQLLKYLFVCGLHPQQHLEYIALFLAYLLPLFVMAIRWGSSFGDHSPIGMVITSLLFHLSCAAFLGFTIWMTFDPPFSPRQLTLGAPLLTLYYLGALSIGYYTGYFLLVFGKEAVIRFQLPQSGPLKFLDSAVIVSLWLFAAATVTGLVYRNTPQIRDTNDDTFQKYASLVTMNLPPTGGFLLSDDPFRLYLVEAALARSGRGKDYVPLDTRSLVWPHYLRFLHDKFPQKWPALVTAKDVNPVNPLGLVAALSLLAKTNELFYLHPSFGYYFEQFYAEPNGLVYRLKPLPDNTLLPPLPDKNQIATNEAFWSQLASRTFDPIERAVAPSDPNAPRSRGERLLDRFHIAREPHRHAALAGFYYSRSLVFWGVQLQRANELEKAAACFALASKINPDNVVAQINLAFNQDRQAGRTVALDLSRTTSDQFGKYRSWAEVLNANGPFDEPSFCFQTGLVFMQNDYYGQRLPFGRQALAQFNRASELVPDNLDARLWMGQIYILSRLPDRTLEALRDPLEQPQKFSLAKTNETELNVTAAAAYFQKNDFSRGIQLLETEIARHPTDDNLINAALQSFVNHGLLTNALTLADRKLRLTPDDPTWLFNKGYVLIQIKAYDEAIDALTRVLAIQTNNHLALFDRAIAGLNSGRLDAARADYLTLQQWYTNSFQIAYGLGEIAWRQHETNEAVRNYKVYLANAGTNTAEAKIVGERLSALKGQAP
jgi:tetratricopeptide (TPR) repeat protein